MTPEQIKQSDLILKIFDEHDGQLNRDDYYNILEKMNFRHFDYEFTKERLLNHYHLIDYIQGGKQWMILTQEGEIASKMGMVKYLEKVEFEKKIEFEKKLVSIKGIKRANILSMVAIFVAILAPVIGKLVNEMDYKSKREISNTKPVQSNPDSLFKSQILEFLNNDSTFKNDLKKMLAD
jgi:hypothetical protein